MGTAGLSLASAVCPASCGPSLGGGVLPAARLAWRVTGSAHHSGQRGQAQKGLFPASAVLSRPAPCVTGRKTAALLFLMLWILQCGCPSPHMCRDPHTSENISSQPTEVCLPGTWLFHFLGMRSRRGAEWKDLGSARPVPSWHLARLLLP